MTRYIFALTFVPFAIVVGETIHWHGKKLLTHAFGTESPVGPALSVLLRIGFYLVALGLLLWNLGVEEGHHMDNQTRYFTEVSLRFGISVFILGFLHGFNVLSLSLFHRKNRN